MSGSSSRRLRVVAIGISILSLGGIALWASQQQAPQLPDSASDWALLAAGLGLYAVAMALRSERWLALLRNSGTDPARSECYGLMGVGFMGNTVLPLRGGDGLRIAYMSKHTSTGLRDSTGVLIAERGLDAITLITVYAILAYGVLSGIDVPDLSSFATAAIAAGAIVVGAVIGVVVLRALGHSGTAREFIVPLLAASSNLRSHHGGRMLVLTIAIWTLEAADLMLLGAAIGLDMHPLEALYLVGLGGIFLLIPSGPGYAGTFDAAILFGAAAIGATGAVAVSFLLVARLVIFVPITVLGAVLMLTRYSKGIPIRGEPAVSAEVVAGAPS